MKTKTRIESELRALPGAAGICIVVSNSERKERLRIECTTRRDIFPLGSVFKLYVLAEFVRQAEEGKIEPEHLIPIDENLKSLPTGELQLVEAGVPYAAHDMATRMIAVSDNTATDHLLARLGRSAIEDRLGDYGNSAPDRNRPFLSTREMFTLKSAGRRRLKQVSGCDSIGSFGPVWSAASPEERAGWLEQLGHDYDALPFGQLQTLLASRTRLASFYPEHVEIEWHARPSDIVALLLQAKQGELISPNASQSFLTLLESGQPFYQPPDLVTHRFKGGFEWGVLTFALDATFEDGSSVTACFCQCADGPPEDESNLPDGADLFVGWIDSLRSEISTELLRGAHGPHHA